MCLWGCRTSPSPLIKLGEKFANIQDYLERVRHGIPDISELEHLTVTGDVVFGARVSLKVRKDPSRRLAY